MKITLPRRLISQFWLWVLVALLIRFVHFSFVSISPLALYPTSDEFEHYSLALGLLSGDWFGLQIGAYHRPQLFAYFLALLLKLTAKNLYLVHLILIFIDSISVGLLWYAARLGLSKKAAFFSGLAALSYWPLIHFSSTLYMESFAIFLQGLMLLAVIQTGRQIIMFGRLTKQAKRRLSGSKAIILAAIFSGLMILTRPQAIIGIPVFLAGFIVATKLGKWPFKKAVIIPVVYLLVLIVTLLPNAFRNYYSSGKWIWYSSNGALNFYFSNNKENISWMTRSPGIEWELFINTPAVEAGIDDDRVDRMRFWRKKSIEFVRQNPHAFLEGVWHKLGLVLNKASIHCTNNFEEYARLSPIQRWAPGFGFWGPISFGGLLFGIYVFVKRFSDKNHPLGTVDISRWWVQGLLGGYAMAYLFGVALFLVIERHRLPALMPLMAFAGVAMVPMAYGICKREWSRVIGGFLCIGLATAIMWIPMVGPEMKKHERYWTYVNLGVANYNLNRWKVARKCFYQAHHIYPDRLEPLHQLAPVETKMGLYASAHAAQCRLLELLQRDYPQHTRVLDDAFARNVVLAALANNWAAAAEAAHNWYLYHPDHKDARHFIKAVEIAQGSPDDQLLVFRKVLDGTFLPSQPRN